MMKITLQVGGKEVSYTESELVSILIRHQEAEMLTKMPKEGVPFLVNIREIIAKKDIFDTQRVNAQQEAMRKLIDEAFSMVLAYPDRYQRSFYTLMPEKTWVAKSVEELEALARLLGGHTSDWVEWVMEIAQRLCNGESWEALCNNPDTAQWFTAVRWKDGKVKLVGGALRDNNLLPAAAIIDVDCYGPDAATVLNFTVPLVTITHF